MTNTPELLALSWIATATVLMWIPTTLARIATQGLMRVMGDPHPSPPPHPLPLWADRARRAHANAIENLVVFAPLVLVAASVGFSTPTTVLAAWTYVIARLAHYVIYVAGIPILRTLAFLAGVGATLVIAGVLLTRLAHGAAG